MTHFRPRDYTLRQLSRAYDMRRSGATEIYRARARIAKRRRAAATPARLDAGRHCGDRAPHRHSLTHLPPPRPPSPLHPLQASTATSMTTSMTTLVYGGGGARNPPRRPRLSPAMRLAPSAKRDACMRDNKNSTRACVSPRATAAAAGAAEKPLQLSRDVRHAQTLQHIASRVLSRRPAALPVRNELRAGQHQRHRHQH